MRYYEVTKVQIANTHEHVQVHNKDISYKMSEANFVALGGVDITIGVVVNYKLCQLLIHLVTRMKLLNTQF